MQDSGQKKCTMERVSISKDTISVSLSCILKESRACRITVAACYTGFWGETLWRRHNLSRLRHISWNISHIEGEKQAGQKKQKCRMRPAHKETQRETILSPFVTSSWCLKSHPWLVLLIIKLKFRLKYSKNCFLANICILRGRSGGRKWYEE